MGGKPSSVINMISNGLSDALGLVQVFVGNNMYRVKAIVEGEIPVNFIIDRSLIHDELTPVMQ